jgi:hypothetical protein
VAKQTDVIGAEDFVLWSDGVRRSPRWHPHDHAVREAIRLMFAARQDEELLKAKWDLEYDRARQVRQCQPSPL